MSNDRPLVLDDLRELWGAVREMSDRQAVLDTKVETHMRNEEAAMDGVRTEIHNVGDKVTVVGVEVQRLLDAMPEDEHGRKDIFGHKIDHKEIREDRTRKEDARRSFRDAASEVAAKVAIGAAVLTFLGERVSTALQHTLH